MPVVDAAMREMYVTGRMHNRARMLVASYLTKHLMTHWKIGLDWFEDCLVDWDPASNAMGWQWSAGSGPDATPYFRVFNPETQAEKFDAHGRYRRKWVAELSAAPPETALSYFDAIPRSWGMAPDAYPTGRWSTRPRGGSGRWRPMKIAGSEGMRSSSELVSPGSSAAKLCGNREHDDDKDNDPRPRETGLPRYFQAVFDQASRMEHGRLDMVLPDGRVFRAEGPKPGPVAELHIHNTDIFARLIREGDLGFCEAYLDEWWSTPDLQAFMDLVHADNEEVYDGFLGMRLVRAYERLRFWLQSNSKRQAKKNISYHYDLGNEFYGLWLDDTMTYSSAKFDTGQESLEAAQIAEIRLHGGPDGRAAGRSCAGDRLRLGRVRRICRQGAGAAGHRADHLEGTARLRHRADRRAGPVGPGGDQAAGLPRRARDL
jgi:hypothetical protein